MSSFRTLVFKETAPAKAWSATGRDLTFLIRRVTTGYLAFLQKWSQEAGEFTMDDVSPDGQMMIFSSLIDAESACQRRYEQELRWMHSRLI